MALTPLEIQKMRFGQRMRGFDPTEVENFLTLVAEELTARLAHGERLERENRYYRQRLEESVQREHQLAHGGDRLIAVQFLVAAQQLPGVDVGHDDELGDDQ